MWDSSFEDITLNSLTQTPKKKNGLFSLLIYQINKFFKIHWS